MVWSYKFKNIEGRSEKVLSERAVGKTRDVFQNPKEKSLGASGLESLGVPCFRLYHESLGRTSDNERSEKENNL